MADPIAPPLDMPVHEAIKAECIKVMADRAKTRDGYGTRIIRAQQLAEINSLLEDYNLIMLGR
jgi:hypothetical protein